MDAYLEMMVTLVKFISGLFIAFGLYNAICVILEAPWFMNKMPVRFLTQKLGKKATKILYAGAAAVFVACGILLYFFAVPTLTSLLSSFKLQ